MCVCVYLYIHHTGNFSRVHDLIKTRNKKHGGCRKGPAESPTWGCDRASPIFLFHMCLHRKGFILLLFRAALKMRAPPPPPFFWGTPGSFLLASLPMRNYKKRQKKKKKRNSPAAGTDCPFFFPFKTFHFPFHILFLFFFALFTVGETPWNRTTKNKKKTKQISNKATSLTRFPSPSV